MTPSLPASARGWKSFLQRWMVTTLGVLVAANVVNGIRYDTTAGLLVASLVLGMLNALLKPVLLLLSLPLLVATLGVFALFINAALLYLVGQVVGPFHVDTFGAAFWGGLLVSVVSLTAGMLFGVPAVRAGWRRPVASPDPRRRPPPPSGSGPVIDV